LRAGTVVLALATCVASAQDLSPQSAAIVRKVDDHYNHLKTLRTRYVEHYAGMGMDRTERGTLELAKPGRMRWAYDVPAGKLFLLDGKYGWSYTPGDPQVERIPAKRLDDLRSPLRFLLGHTELRKELDGVTVAQDGSGYRISGVPKGLSQRVKMLTLGVDAGGEIQTMRLEEIDGAVTEFSFTEMKENVPLGSKEFVFVPPAGVGVVDGLPPV